MKVILVNGSPHPLGCTFTALDTVAGILAAEGIDTEFFQVGIKPMSGCIGCLGCAETARCVFDDRVNEFLDLADAADGFVFGSPVHYASISGAMTCFLDRAFFTTICSRNYAFRLKPGAVLVSARRSGTTAALDQLNKYLTWAEMPVISSRYWNMVHGNKPEDVKNDLEGLQIMRVLARNMAFFLNCKEAGISMPEQEERISTSFIR